MSTVYKGENYVAELSTCGLAVAKLGPYKLVPFFSFLCYFVLFYYHVYAKGSNSHVPNCAMG